VPLALLCCRWALSSRSMRSSLFATEPRGGR
jgi:hypothetical protein